MRILALQTDFDKLKEHFISSDEREIMTAHFHWFKFFGAFMWCGLLTIISIVLAIWVPLEFQVSSMVVITILLLLWLLLVFPRFIRAYIDWQYDCVVITTDKVVIVDQSSIFRQKITPINLENVSGVSTETQFWNLFHLGTLHLDLNESAGAEHTLRYVKHAHEVAAAITEALTSWQRRKDLRRYPHGEVKDEV
jgi:uncharacterized membrane protein YdbT with pleckstrin-like domain